MRIVYTCIKYEGSFFLLLFSFDIFFNSGYIIIISNGFHTNLHRRIVFRRAQTYFSLLK